MSPVHTSRRGRVVAPAKPWSGGERRWEVRTLSPPPGVMAGLDPAIHANTGGAGKSASPAAFLSAPTVFAWVPGSSPGMTQQRWRRGAVVPGVSPHPSRAFGARPPDQVRRVAPAKPGSGGERHREVRTAIAPPTSVMAGLDPAIHANTGGAGKSASPAAFLSAPTVFAWVPGSSPGMTQQRWRRGAVAPGVGPPPVTRFARATLPVPVRDGCEPPGGMRSDVRSQSFARRPT